MFMLSDELMAVPISVLPVMFAAIEDSREADSEMLKDTRIVAFVAEFT